MSTATQVWPWQLHKIVQRTVKPKATTRSGRNDGVRIDSLGLRRCECRRPRMKTLCHIEEPCRWHGVSSSHRYCHLRCSRARQSMRRTQGRLRTSRQYIVPFKNYKVWGTASLISIRFDPQRAEP